MKCKYKLSDKNIIVSYQQETVRLVIMDESLKFGDFAPRVSKDTSPFEEMMSTKNQDYTGRINTLSISERKKIMEFVEVREVDLKLKKELLDQMRRNLGKKEFVSEYDIYMCRKMEHFESFIDTLPTRDYPHRKSTVTAHERQHGVIRTIMEGKHFKGKPVCKYNEDGTPYEPKPGLPILLVSSKNTIPEEVLEQLDLENCNDISAKSLKTDVLNSGTVKINLNKYRNRKRQEGLSNLKKNVKLDNKEAQKEEQGSLNGNGISIKVTKNVVTPYAKKKLGVLSQKVPNQIIFSQKVSTKLPVISHWNSNPFGMRINQIPVVQNKSSKKVGFWGELNSKLEQELHSIGVKLVGVDLNALYKVGVVWVGGLIINMEPAIISVCGDWLNCIDGVFGSIDTTTIVSQPVSDSMSTTANTTEGEQIAEVNTTSFNVESSGNNDDKAKTPIEGEPPSKKTSNMAIYYVALGLFSALGIIVYIVVSNSGG